MLEPLKTMRAAEIKSVAEEERWLIESLWPDSAVGVLGGQPKSFKTFLALDLAISVASGTPCLGRYAVAVRSRALVYLAEDGLLDVRSRIEGIAKSRGLGLDDLDLDIIAEPVLRLDQEPDQRRLRQTIERMKPRLLVLDPLVRLHRLDDFRQLFDGFALVLRAGADLSDLHFQLVQPGAQSGGLMGEVHR